MFLVQKREKRKLSFFFIVFIFWANLSKAENSATRCRQSLAVIDNYLTEPEEYFQNIVRELSLGEAVDNAVFYLANLDGISQEKNVELWKDFVDKVREKYPDFLAIEVKHHDGSVIFTNGRTIQQFVVFTSDGQMYQGERSMGGAKKPPPLLPQTDWSKDNNWIVKLKPIN